MCNSGRIGLQRKEVCSRQWCNRKSTGPVWLPQPYLCTHSSEGLLPPGWMLWHTRVDDVVIHILGKPMMKPSWQAWQACSNERLRLNKYQKCWVLLSLPWGKTRHWLYDCITVHIMEGGKVEKRSRRGSLDLTISFTESLGFAVLNWELSRWSFRCTPKLWGWHFKFKVDYFMRMKNLPCLGQCQSSLGFSVLLTSNIMCYSCPYEWKVTTTHKSLLSSTQASSTAWFIL